MSTVYERAAVAALQESKDQSHNDDTKLLWATRAVAYSNLAVAEAIRGNDLPGGD